MLFPLRQAMLAVAEVAVALILDQTRQMQALKLILVEVGIILVTGH